MRRRSIYIFIYILLTIDKSICLHIFLRFQFLIKRKSKNKKKWTKSNDASNKYSERKFLQAQLKRSVYPLILSIVGGCRHFFSFSCSSSSYWCCCCCCCYLRKLKVYATFYGMPFWATVFSCHNADYVGTKPQK